MNNSGIRIETTQISINVDKIRQCTTLLKWGYVIEKCFSYFKDRH